MVSLMLQVLQGWHQYVFSLRFTQRQKSPIVRSHEDGGAKPQKEMVPSYLKILSQHSAGSNEENHKTNSRLEIAYFSSACVQTSCYTNMHSALCSRLLIWRL